MDNFDDEKKEKIIEGLICETYNFVVNNLSEDETFEIRTSCFMELKNENKQASEEEVTERSILNIKEECEKQLLIALSEGKTAQLCDELGYDVVTTQNCGIIIERLVGIVAKEVKKTLKAKYIICLPVELISKFDYLALQEIKDSMLPCIDLLLEFEIINATQENRIDKFKDRLKVKVKINNKTNFIFSTIHFNCVFFDENGKTIDVEEDWIHNQMRKTEEFGKLSFDMPENATNYKIHICDVRIR